MEDTRGQGRADVGGGPSGVSREAVRETCRRRDLLLSSVTHRVERVGGTPT
jgi:hypothetical protein